MADPKQITIQDMQGFVHGTVKECAAILPAGLKVLIMLFPDNDGPVVFATNATRERVKSVIRAANDQANGNRIITPS